MAISETTISDANIHIFIDNRQGKKHTPFVSSEEKRANLMPVWNNQIKTLNLQPDFDASMSNIAIKAFVRSEY